MAELGTKEVTLIGGEAYLRDDWTTIARAVRAHGMDCTMTTGGRGLTLERVIAAKEAGIRSVSVSVDGLEETHDALRGVKGSFRSAFEAMANLKKGGIPFSANSQFGRKSIKEMPEVFDRLIAAGIHSWQTQITVAMGRAVDEPELLLEPYQMLEVLAMLARLKPVADANRVRIWPGNNIGYFGPYETLLRGTLPRGHMASCGAGRSTLGIEADGSIKGCPSLPTLEYTGGNIRDVSLKDIWERSAPLRFTRDRTVEDLWGHCRDCYYNDTCRAGCSWTTHVLLGRPGNNPYLPPPRAGAAAQGPPRAGDPGRGRPGRALRPRALRHRRRRLARGRARQRTSDLRRPARAGSRTEHPTTDKRESHVPTAKPLSRLFSSREGR
jgi:radical SAM protein with 4Fe4S-binding SPASM domain